MRETFSQAMTTEGVRAAAAAFANGDAAVYDKEREKIEKAFRDGVNTPYVFLAIPAMSGPKKYEEFLMRELNGTGLSFAVAGIYEEVVVIARNKEMCTKGIAYYRLRSQLILFVLLIILLFGTIAFVFFCCLRIAHT